jgi:heme exporter protein D
MIWNSASDFFAMGGYALYVWGSAVVVFGSMAGELLLLKLRSNSIRQQLINASASNSRRTGRKQ